MSMIAICTTIKVKFANTRFLVGAAAPSSVWWISSTLFASRNRPPPASTMSRPEMPRPATSNQGCVSRISQTIENSSAMRVSIASARPMMRALFCRGGGSRPTRIARKMMLSMPRTISSTVRVAKATQAAGSVSSSSI
jgi:hypothetical protein